MTPVPSSPVALLDQLDLFTEVEKPARTEMPGHRYQEIGTCQCRLRENDSVSGMWSSVDRFGVLSRLAMTPAEHAEHLASLLLAALSVTP